MNANENKGLKCPNERCGTLIRFTYQDLLYKNQVSCPACKLVLTVEVPGEIKKHISEINHAQKMVEEAKTFKR